MENTLTIESLQELEKKAKEFYKHTKNNTIFAFFGSMGAGKTTFIKALCQEMDVVDTVTSPTFALINEYQTKKSETIYHFDFYRIKTLSEVYDLGYEDYFYSGHVCLIEWPELVEDILPESTLKIKLSVTDDGTRKLSF